MQMLEGISWVFFALMVVVLFASYIIIRRELFAPGITAGVAALATIVLMILVSLSQGNALLQAVIVGIVVGGLFSAVTLGAAWYFHSQEAGPRRDDIPADMMPPQDEF